MEYSIDIPALYEMTHGIVSREAGIAYDDAGNSLYDGIVISSGDEPTVNRYIGNAVSALLTRAWDICTVRGAHSTALGVGEFKERPAALLFAVPDMDKRNEEIAAAEISSYISNAAAADWFVGHYPLKAEEYARRAQVSMDKAVALLKTVSAPERRHGGRWK